MNENYVMAPGNSNADFNRNKGVYKLGLLCRVFINTLQTLLNTIFLTVAC